MRCLSCGYVNAPQTFECARCKKLLDPIAAAATVALPVESAPPSSSAMPSNFPGGYSFGNGAPPMPDLPPLPRSGGQMSPPPLPPNLGMNPPRRMIISADENYLAESAGAGRFLNPTTQDYANVRVDSCQRCGKKVELARGEYICQDCVTERSGEQKKAESRDNITRMLGGLVAGVIVAVICIVLAAQFGAAKPARDLNWELTLLAGVLIGTAVRLGGQNKPTIGLQLLGVFIGLIGIAGCIFVALGAYGSVGLSVDGVTNAIKATAPSIVDYIYPAGGLLLAFVIPSGLFGGSRVHE